MTMPQTGTLSLTRDRFDPARALIVFNGEPVGSVPWQVCDETARLFRRAAEAGQEHEKRGGIVVVDDDYVIPAGVPFRLERDPHDPTRTLITMGGAQVGSVPWIACYEISASFSRAARAGEEHEKANDIIEADATLIRTGAPFALSNNARIREESFKEAQWGDARKRMPLLGVPSAKGCGTPTVIKHRIIGGH